MSANADGALPLEIRSCARQIKRLEKLLAVGFADMPHHHEAQRQVVTVGHYDFRFGIVRGSFTEVRDAPCGCVLQEPLVVQRLVTVVPRRLYQSV